MNIIKKDSLPTLTRFKNKEDFINQIIQNIAVVCRENKTFTVQNKIKKLNEHLFELRKKDSKLNELLNKSGNIKKDFQNQVIELEEDNLNSKKKLLEFLGSEL